LLVVRYRPNRTVEFVPVDFRIHPPRVWTQTFCVALLNTHARIFDVPTTP
jgi:hypothetical protein